MAPNLSKNINKTILVSIPALSADATCRPYKLTGVELVGLWLESPDLANRFLLPEHRSPAPQPQEFFIPFSQIAGVAVIAAPPAGSGAAASPSQVQDQAQDPSVPRATAEGSPS